MSDSIDVNKHSVTRFLQTAAISNFFIPDYQRPYSWEKDQVEALFEDLISFTKENIDNSNISIEQQKNYFLGSIVVFNNQDGQQEIIDGQQRTTTLFLILRAIYAKLESMNPSDERSNFMTQIEGAIWKQHPFTGKADKKFSLIRYSSFQDSYIQTFENILQHGTISEASINNRYAQNYRLIIDKLEDFCAAEPELFYKFIRNLLHFTIVLLIKAKSQDTALTIFTTLNDRGLSLTDADIFKSHIYKNLESDKDKKEFIEAWNKITERAEKTVTDKNLDKTTKLFTYYMSYLRAQENDTVGFTPGTRSFFMKENRLLAPKLKVSELIENINHILDLLEVINLRNEIEGLAWTTNHEILSILDILNTYPEFWKAPVIIYYITNHRKPNFEESFKKFLRKLFVNLFKGQAASPTISSVKKWILNLNIAIVKEKTLEFEFTNVEKEKLQLYFKTMSKNKAIDRMILKILAYNTAGQKTLLPHDWEIEHILPKKYQNQCFENDQRLEELIDTIGNKIPLEKKLNIVASNGWTAKKREHYRDSAIAITKDLGKNEALLDWKIDNIETRNKQVIEELFTIFDRWDNEITTL